MVEFRLTLDSNPRQKAVLVVGGVCEAVHEDTSGRGMERLAHPVV